MNRAMAFRRWLARLIAGRRGRLGNIEIKPARLIWFGLACGGEEPGEWLDYQRQLATDRWLELVPGFAWYDGKATFPPVSDSDGAYYLVDRLALWDAQEGGHPLGDVELPSANLSGLPRKLKRGENLAISGIHVSVQMLGLKARQEDALTTMPCPRCGPEGAGLHIYRAQLDGAGVCCPRCGWKGQVELRPIGSPDLRDRSTCHL